MKTDTSNTGTNLYQCHCNHNRKVVDDTGPMNFLLTLPSDNSGSRGINFGQ